MSHPALLGPQLTHQGLWEALFLPDGIKSRLRNHALLAMQLRGQGANPERLPVHGLIVLVGPPGTGKTTLARGLPFEIEAMSSLRVKFFELDTHQLSSELLGASQRSVTQLLNEHVPAAVGASPSVILVDEVEAMATARSAASFETNPVDVHRATDAVLAGLDHLARDVPNLLVVATTNFPAAVDEALLSRADLVLDIPSPDVTALRRIIRDTLDELASRYPELRVIADSPELDAVAEHLKGTDARRARKVVLDALARDVETTLDPGKLTIERLTAAAHASNRSGRVVELARLEDAERAS